MHFLSSYTCKTCGKAFVRVNSPPPPRHQITCHLPPCPAPWPSATTVARTSQENSSLSKIMFVVHGALQNTAKLMAHKRISWAICYITFKTRFSFKEHLKSSPHLLAARPAGVKGGFVWEYMLLLGGITVEDKDTFPASTVTWDSTAARSWWSTKEQPQERQRVHQCNVCDKSFMSLSTPSHHKIW